MARNALAFNDTEDPSLAIYLREIRRTSLLTPEGEVELARKVRKGDRSAHAALVQANLRFVVSVAKRYQGRGLGLADLIEEGNVGLMKAADRFDEQRGFRFISYAIWWIRQSILQALNDQSRTIRLPVNRGAKTSRIDRAAQKLEQKLERVPTAEEVADLLELSEKDVLDHQMYGLRPISLDAPTGDEGQTPLVNLVEDEGAPAPDEVVAESDLAKDLADALEGLDARESKILKDYFGIETGEGTTLEAIGKDLGLTRERVRQLKERAIRKLFLRKDRDRLRSYLT